MIKKTKNTRQQLLRKNSDQSITPPFEVQDYCSSVGNEDRDSGDHEQSYYCLEKELVNPYFVEMVNRNKDQEMPIRKKNCSGDDKVSGGNLPEKVTMNGNCYVKISDGEKEVLQESKAQCGACGTLQMIPKNSPKFICYNCRTICQCTKKPHPSPSPTNQPKRTKLFRCGVCNVKVQYEAGISQYIKCTKCNTINQVLK